MKRALAYSSCSIPPLESACDPLDEPWSNESIDTSADAAREVAACWRAASKWNEPGIGCMPLICAQLGTGATKCC